MRRKFLLLACVSLCLLATFTMAKQIADCCCEAETVDVGNDEELHSRLQQLRDETFFKIFKVNLESECPFWEHNAQCTRKGCSVCPCDEQEIPDPWKRELNTGVDRTMHPTFQRWKEDDEEAWIVQDDSSHMSFINMQLNPEGFSGYEGQEAWRIWNAIYEQNCFHGGTQNMCFEQRVFYRLISGIHAASSTHIANNYPLPSKSKTGRPGSDDEAVLGPNLEIYENKIGDHPERIENVYFAFVFLLRALNKASPVLLEYDYSTGNEQEDARVRKLMTDLLNSRIVSQCNPSQSFDETVMFADPNTLSMKRQFKNAFRNISMIMDCVGCEKCKLHGKLQILGVGTALKIIFSRKQLTPADLQRNEVMALITTLAKLSQAIKVIHEMEWRRTAHKLFLYAIMTLMVGTLLAGSMLLCLVWRKRRKQAAMNNKNKSTTSDKNQEPADHTSIALNGHALNSSRSTHDNGMSNSGNLSSAVQAASPNGKKKKNKNKHKHKPA